MTNHKDGHCTRLFYRKVAMTINWKQGLFAAAVLLTASLLFVGCSKSKADKAVADKSTGEIIGEEIDVIEVVPAQNPNAKHSISSHLSYLWELSQTSFSHL